MDSKRKELIGWVAAVMLIVGGAATLLIVRNRSTDFGYAEPMPITGGAYMPGAFELTQTLNVVAAAALILGLVAGGFIIGLRVGRKTRSATA